MPRNGTPLQLGMEFYNEYKTTHLHKILERVQRQQKEDSNQQHGVDQPLGSPSLPVVENGSRSLTHSPEPRGNLNIPSHKDMYSRCESSNNNPQDEVLDYSKSGSCKKRLLVPTYQTSIFSGEFRNSAELQNFERLLELRYAKRKGKNKTLMVEIS